MKYIITYIDKSEITKKDEESDLIVEGGRDTLFATIEDMKKRGIKITEVLRVNKNEVYTPIKF